MIKDTLGDKLKEYEGAETSRKAMIGLPLLARLDGRSFHTFTKKFPRPYFPTMSKWMQELTAFLVDDTNACIGYTQSDEISLVWNLTSESSQFLFGGRFQKLTSVLAGLASAKFNQLVLKDSPSMAHMLPCFDCRVWQVPDLDTAADVFKWRELDATKNSITMAASTEYSHKELHCKTGKEKIEMLWQKGIDWNAYPTFFKRGTYFRRELFSVYLSEDELAKIPSKHRPDGPVMRHRVVEVEMPPVTRIENFVDVIFKSAAPYNSKVVHDKIKGVPIHQGVDEQIVTLEYQDSCDVVNAVESIAEALTKFGVKLELLEGGDGYEQVRISAVE